MYHITPVAFTADPGEDVRRFIVLLMISLGNKGINNVSMLDNEEGETVKLF